jgi:hypothetical protein
VVCVCRCRIRNPGVLSALTTEGLYADSRTGQKSNRGFVVSILKQIAERDNIENGDEVWWTDDGDGLEFILPSEM